MYLILLLKNQGKLVLFHKILKKKKEYQIRVSIVSNQYQIREIKTQDTTFFKVINTKSLWRDIGQKKKIYSKLEEKN